ncbi:MAG TPA: hypothetical protein VL944_03040 [Candidatus Acidoferrum sp.]|nr:hypothetical protein [Candidatus Acidoferrum sp.]
MLKKFVYIGLALIAVSVVLFFAAHGLLTSVAQGLLAEQNTTVANRSFSYIALPLSNESVFVAAAASSPINFYLFNTTGFSDWTAALGTNASMNGYDDAIALEGGGLLYGYHNVVEATIPPTHGGLAENATGTAVANQSFYGSASISQGLSGTYYAVIDNTNGSASSSTQVMATFLYLSPTANFAGKEAAALGLIVMTTAFIVLLIIGLALIVYGFMKKPKTDASGTPLPTMKDVGGMTDKQIDMLYKSVGKKSKHIKSGNRKSTVKRKR